MNMNVFGKIFSALTSAKLPGGVVGRNLLSAAATCFALGLTVFAPHGNVWTIAFAIVAMVAIYWRGSDQANKFAKEHPELATLEGSQITTHRKTIQAYESKNNPPVLPVDEVKTVPAEEVKAVGVAAPARLPLNVRDLTAADDEEVER
ncbi:hypothetical protein [Burkholderia vietnamiensis]|uniref:hypothetical protein n=1 Tax=Burkholderia vietnamiensis TaxID=60552 RepID=UPI001CF3C965|nr:hypothetical protein [Burkholderia vietnamiensis]MCA8229891.1 hypothetical protein [Burkholderia vietnamiensis]